jgi:cytidylate kinase
MDLRFDAAHAAEALMKADAHPAEAGATTPARAFTITLSREVGARGAGVARELGALLGWSVYDNELLQRVAEELNVNVNRLQELDERPGSWLRETVEAFAAAAPVSELAYFRRLLRVVLSLGAQGECIILGRGAGFILPPATTLRVRLCAPLEDRIAHMSRELKVSRDEAARYVVGHDRDRTRFLRDHFRRDPADPLNFDLVLNTSRFSVPGCAALIVEALRRLQHRTRVAAASAAPA